MRDSLMYMSLVRQIAPPFLPPHTSAFVRRASAPQARTPKSHMTLMWPSRSHPRVLALDRDAVVERRRRVERRVGVKVERQKSGHLLSEFCMCTI